MDQVKKLITSIVVVGMLSYILLATEDNFTRIVVLPFLLFSLAYFLQFVFLLIKKKKLAMIMGKIRVIVFAIYWFVFLIVWDCISIANRNYTAFLCSLLLWLGGGWIIYKRFKGKC